MATSNLFLSHANAERRALLAADRLQEHGVALDALWQKMERLQGSRHSADKGWLTRYHREFIRVSKLERRALRDWEREVARANAFAKEIKQRQRDAAIDRRKAKVTPKAKAAAPKPLAKEAPPKGRKPKKRVRREGGYEYVLKVKYKPTKHTSEARHHSVWWDVRLRKADGSKASAIELQGVVRHIKTHGETPKGWDATGIRWDRGARPTWNQLPSRDAESSGQDVGAVLASLSSTLMGDSRVESARGYEIGEEQMESDEYANE